MFQIKEQDKFPEIDLDNEKEISDSPHREFKTIIRSPRSGKQCMNKEFQQRD